MNALPRDTPTWRPSIPVNLIAECYQRLLCRYVCKHMCVSEGKFLVMTQFFVKILSLKESRPTEKLQDYFTELLKKYSTYFCSIATHWPFYMERDIFPLNPKKARWPGYLEAFLKIKYIFKGTSEEGKKGRRGVLSVTAPANLTELSLCGCGLSTSHTRTVVNVSYKRPDSKYFRLYSLSHDYSTLPLKSSGVIPKWLKWTVSHHHSQNYLQ